MHDQNSTNNSIKIEELEQVLQYRFQKKELLEQALRHPSVAQDEIRLPNNERLEFLGDAVINLVLGLELYLRYPEADEGMLSKARALLVRKESLAIKARQLGLQRFLQLGKGEERSGGRERDSILASAFEALFGAIFLDGGLEPVRQLVSLLFYPELINKQLYEEAENPKNALLELVQSFSQEPPRYEVVSVTGPDHARVYECAVFHMSKELGRGRGSSKKAAEMDAAAEALARLRRELSK